MEGKDGGEGKEAKTLVSFKIELGQFRKWIT